MAPATENQVHPGRTKVDHSANDEVDVRRLVSLDGPGRTPSNSQRQKPQYLRLEDRGGEITLLIAT